MNIINVIPKISLVGVSSRALYSRPLREVGSLNLFCYEKINLGWQALCHLIRPTFALSHSNAINYQERCTK